uniref:Caspase-1 n=1 Tax=Sarcophilus harrisii TaxID=9305 RepID=G3VHS6_SARHA
MFFTDIILKEKRKRFVESANKGVISGLLDDLLEIKVLNQEEMEIVREENKTINYQALRLIDNVSNKGSKASQHLIKSIIERDRHLADKLGLFSGILMQAKYHISQGIFYFAVPPTFQDIAADTLRLCSHEDFQRLRKEMAGQIYPVMEKETRTCLAFIIWNVKFDYLPQRTGANNDITGMQDLLEGLGYRVDVEKNLTALLKQFASRLEHQTSDSTFLVLMSHGVTNGICGKDYTDIDRQILPIERIFQIFNTRNCPSLKDKAKIIILQACRGGNSGTVWANDSVTPFADAHVEKDFIAFCSSTPNNKSWRHTKKGSLFIIQLIDCFRKYAWCCHLYDIFWKVQHSFEMPMEKIQMPTIERATLTKYFYLFPGN